MSLRDLLVWRLRLLLPRHELKSRYVQGQLGDRRLSVFTLVLDVYLNAMQKYLVLGLNDVSIVKLLNLAGGQLG